MDDLDLELPLLLEAVFRKYHYDFRHYAHASLRRRAAAALPALGVATVSQLQDLVLRDAAAFSRLLSLLTIPVTELFRDPGYFRALREDVVPVLRTYPSLKLWIAGCSTGEEVWSFLVLLAEEALLDRTVVYATDINPESLARAEAGVYPLERAQRYSRNYLAAGGRGSLSDWYTAGYDGIVFDRRLKERTLFSDHSLATDHVFAEVQLVSCRNVLIYFDRELQDRALGLFADALVRRGFLGLGARESLRFTAHAARFEPFLREHRIWRKRP